MPQLLTLLRTFVQGHIANSNFRYYKMHIYFLLVIISVFIDEAGLRAGRSCYTSFCVAALGRRSPVHSLLTSDLPTDIHSSLKTQSPVLTLQTCKSLLCTKPNFYSFRDITANTSLDVTDLHHCLCD